MKNENRFCLIVQILLLRYWICGHSFYRNKSEITSYLTSLIHASSLHLMSSLGMSFDRLCSGTKFWKIRIGDGLSIQIGGERENPVAVFI